MIILSKQKSITLTTPFPTVEEVRKSLGISKARAKKLRAIIEDKCTYCGARSVIHPMDGISGVNFIADHKFNEKPTYEQYSRRELKKAFPDLSKKQLDHAIKNKHSVSHIMWAQMH